jgi:hypothetical protein
MSDKVTISKKHIEAMVHLWNAIDELDYIAELYSKGSSANNYAMQAKAKIADTFGAITSYINYEELKEKEVRDE